MVRVEHLADWRPKSVEIAMPNRADGVANALRYAFGTLETSLPSDLSGLLARLDHVPVSGRGSAYRPAP